MLYLRIYLFIYLEDLKMKLILKTNTSNYYFHHFHGGDLIIVQRYDGVEHVWSYAEAIRRGIIQFNKNHERIVVGTSWFYNQPSIEHYRKF
jgi:hypothetical protein